MTMVTVKIVVVATGALATEVVALNFIETIVVMDPLLWQPVQLQWFPWKQMS